MYKQDIWVGAALKGGGLIGLGTVRLFVGWKREKGWGGRLVGFGRVSFANYMTPATYQISYITPLKKRF